MDGEKLAYTCSGIIFSHKKKEILHFAVIWKNMDDNMLIEITQTETNTA
jgi:hypothetical protein